MSKLIDQNSQVRVATLNDILLPVVVMTMGGVLIVALKTIGLALGVGS